MKDQQLSNVIVLDPITSAVQRRSIVGSNESRGSSLVGQHARERSQTAGDQYEMDNLGKADRNPAPVTTQPSKTITSPSGSTSSRSRGQVLLRSLSGISLVVVYLAALGAMILTALDIFTADDEPFSTASSPKTIAILGSYAGLALSAFLITVNRLFRVRKALTNIPKLRMPISRVELPYLLHERIHTRLADVMTMNFNPRLEDIQRPGWEINDALLTERQIYSKSTPSAQMASTSYGRWKYSKSAVSDHAQTEVFLHYKRSILSTFVLIQSADSATTLNESMSTAKTSIFGGAVDSINPQSMNISTTQRTRKIRHAAVSTFLRSLATTYNIEQEIIEFYSKVFDKARFSNDELTGQEYKSAMKCVVLIVKRITAAH